MQGIFLKKNREIKTDELTNKITDHLIIIWLIERNPFFESYVFIRAYVNPYHSGFLLLVQVTPVHCITIIIKFTNGFVLVSAYRFVVNN
jgi:hypothetical protein